VNLGQPQPSAPVNKHPARRGLFGATVGYNYQLNNIVFGVEGDWSGGRLSGSSLNTSNYNCGLSCDNKITSVATLRGRLGLAWNQFLFYGTAGGAWERLQASLGNPVLVSSTTTKSNFVWGVGAEYAFTKNLSAKVEYLRTTTLGTFV
jgi:outer membrane immunogenic protein